MTLTHSPCQNIFLGWHFHYSHNQDTGFHPPNLMMWQKSSFWIHQEGQMMDNFLKILSVKSHQQGLKFSLIKFRKNLKISVFGGPIRYLVIFVFVLPRLDEYLFFLLFANTKFQAIWKYLNLVFFIKENTNKICIFITLIF